MKKIMLLVVTSLFVALLMNYGFINGDHTTNQEFALKEIGHIPTEGDTYVVQAVGNIVYILDFAEGFLIYNVSDPVYPILLGSYEGNNHINPRVKGGHSFFVRGDYAIVGFAHAGLKILDISDPTDLQVIGEYFGGGFSADIMVVDNLVYLTMGYDGLQIINISIVTQPTKVGEFSNGTRLSHINVIRNFAYIDDNEQNKLLCLDITDPSNITKEGQFEWLAIDIEMVVDIGYVAAYNYGMMVYDFSNPSNPILLSQHYDGGSTCDVEVIGDFSFVADHMDGFEILDITDPENPIEIDQFNDGGASINVFIEGNVAYVAEHEDGLEIIQLWEENASSTSSITTPEATKTTAETIESESTPSFELLLIILGLFFLRKRMSFFHRYPYGKG
ncbi:MAG: LVIVD repeat-containing protein [Candidatus Hodarchaeota archaeon]